MIIKASDEGLFRSSGRSRGGIAGCLGLDNFVDRQKFKLSLPASTTFLEQDPIADYDCCAVTGTPISTLADLQEYLRAGDVSKIAGAFAVAYYEADGAVTIARDAVGEKSLYYHASAKGFFFATKVEFLLNSGLVPRQVNERAILRFLSYAYLPGRETLVEGVYQLLPGESVTYRNGEIFRQQYWNPQLEPSLDFSEDELCIKLRASLEAAVHARLPKTGAVAASLSGGIDSSLVVALVRRMYSGEVTSYSISFGPSSPNELEYSGLVARSCGIEHRILELSPQIILQYFDETIGEMDIPIGDPLTVPNALLFREAAKHCDVVFNGEGGDPCFGGPKNIPMVLSELYGSHIEDFEDTDSDFSTERSFLRSHLKCFDDLKDMLHSDMRYLVEQNFLERELSDLFTKKGYPSLVSRLQLINILFKGAHHILPKINSLSAPFGVRPRSPLFDRKIVELSLLIPSRLKLNGSVEKYLLKEAVRDIVPEEIIARPKSGMMVPVEGWFQGPLRGVAWERLMDGLRMRRIVDSTYLEQLLTRSLGTLRPRHGAKMWLLLTLDSWLRTFRL